MLSAAAAAAGIAGAPKFSFGQSTGGKTFIKVFMRGGADGLHLMPAVGDPDLVEGYYGIRPNIAIDIPNPNDGNSAIELMSGGFRALNPNLFNLMPIWEEGNLMFSPAAAIMDANRSHFDCQRWIGLGDRRNDIDGYMNRYLTNISGTDHTLRGLVAGKDSIPAEFFGQRVVPAIRDAGSFEIENRDFCSGDGCADNQLTDYMREISSHEVDLSAAEGMAKESQFVMLEAIDEIKAAGADYTPSVEPPLGYTNSDLGRGLRLIAQLLKAGVPVEVASLDWNIGWDTHSNQVDINSANPVSDQNKRYNQRLVEGATNFLTFYRDMGVAMNDIVVLSGSEFGRTARENGSVGTDHGRGGVWFAFGGPTNSTIGRDIPSVNEQGRGGSNWVAPVVDYKDIVSEIMVRHLGMSEGMISTIFPQHSFTNEGYFTRVS